VFAAWLLWCASVISVASAQSGPCEAAPDTIEALSRSLLCSIESLSDYRPDPANLPRIVFLPQPQLEAKVCDEPCNAQAAFVPREGIYLAGNLNPLREVVDRAALLHELVHFLQQGHAKFAALTGCARELAKEEEAYALQNAYLAAQKSERRVIFYRGAFDC
jgi:hypothetical protein